MGGCHPSSEGRRVTTGYSRCDVDLQVQAATAAAAHSAVERPAAYGGAAAAALQAAAAAVVAQSQLRAFGRIADPMLSFHQMLRTSQSPQGRQPSDGQPCRCD